MTILSQIYSPIQRIEQALQRIFSDPQFLEKKTGPKLENTNLLHSSPPVADLPTFPHFAGNSRKAVIGPLTFPQNDFSRKGRHRRFANFFFF